MSDSSGTGVRVYGCNHVAIEVDDIEKAVAFYKDVFNLEQLDEGEGDAFFKLGEHQFLAIFEVDKVQWNDNSAPQITVPENIVTKPQRKRVNGQKGAFVSFSVSAFDQDDGNVPAFANPPSGSLPGWNYDRDGELH